MRIPALALLIPLVPFAAQSQLSLDPVGRSAGGVWIRQGGDPWSALSAPPLLATVGAFTAGAAHFPSAWGLEPLTSSAVAAAIPAGPGVAGLSLTRFGSGLYAEIEGGLAWGASAGALLYGAAFRLRHLSIERYGTAVTPRVDVAAAVTAPEWFLWGVRITDLNRGAVGRSGERLRQGLTIAAALVPRGLPSLHLQAGNDDGSAFSLRAGLSFEVRPVTVRAGSSGAFDRVHAGIDLPAGHFLFGYGVVVHPVLGWSHSFWLAAGVGR